MLTCKIVVGSWGSYNSCNERALGSAWLDLTEYDNWDEVCEELEREGFELYGNDEELFIQDIDSDIEGFNCDYMHPATYFNLLKEGGIFEHSYKTDIAAAYIEACGFESWAKLVNDYGDCWDDDIIFWENMDMVDVAHQYIEECYNLSEFAERYFDYEAFARDLSYGNIYETSKGVIEIR